MPSASNDSGAGEPSASPAAATSLAGERRRGFRVLLAALVIFGIGQSMLFAVLPPLAREIGISETRVAFIFSLSAFVWVLCSLPWGRVSDSRGRRPVIMIGLAGHAISTLGFAIAADLGRRGVLTVGGCYASLVTMRAIFGMLGAGIVPAVQAYVVDRTLEDERLASLGAIGAAFGIGMVVGPAFAGGLSHFGLTVPLYTAAAIASIALFLVWRFTPERTRPSARARRFELRASDPRLWILIAITLGVSVVQAVMMQIIGFFVIDEFGVPLSRGAQFAGIAMTASGMSALAVQLMLMQKLRATPMFLVRVGLVLGFASNAWIVLAPTFASFVAGMACAGLFFATTVTGLRTAATQVAGPEHQGAAAGLMNAALGLGYVLTPLIVLLLYEGVAPVAPYVMNLVALAGLLAALRAARKHMTALG
jgi:MFS family permease